MSARRSFASALLGTLALSAAAACTDLESAEGVAAAFMDRYYVEADHARALLLAAGDAARRIEEEKSLAAQGRAQGAIPQGLQSNVYYQRLRVEPREAGRTDVTFRLRIQPQAGGEPFFKDAKLVMRKDGAWKVHAFAEHEAAR